MTNPDTLDKALDIIREQQAEIARLNAELLPYRFDPGSGTYRPEPWGVPVVTCTGLSCGALRLVNDCPETP